MSEVTIPQYVRPFLWSYDVERLDLARDQMLIIKNILDYGSKDATDWLRRIYTREEIRTVIAATPASAWSRKSLALWTLLYDVVPSRQTRFA